MTNPTPSGPFPPFNSYFCLPEFQRAMTVEEQLHAWMEKYEDVVKSADSWSEIQQLISEYAELVEENRRALEATQEAVTNMQTQIGEITSDFEEQKNTIIGQINTALEEMEDSADEVQAKITEFEQWLNGKTGTIENDIRTEVLEMIQNLIAKDIFDEILSVSIFAEVSGYYGSSVYKSGNEYHWNHANPIRANFALSGEGYLANANAREANPITKTVNFSTSSGVPQYYSYTGSTKTRSNSGAFTTQFAGNSSATVSPRVLFDETTIQYSPKPNLWYQLATISDVINLNNDVNAVKGRVSTAESNITGMMSSVSNAVTNSNTALQIASAITTKFSGSSEWCYVDQDRGSDSTGDGTSANPFRSCDHGYSVFVRSGKWAANQAQFNLAASASPYEFGTGGNRLSGMALRISGAGSRLNVPATICNMSIIASNIELICTENADLIFEGCYIRVGGNGLTISHGYNRTIKFYGCNMVSGGPFVINASCSFFSCVVLTTVTDGFEIYPSVNTNESTAFFVHDCVMSIYNFKFHADSGSYTGYPMVWRYSKMSIRGFNIIGSRFEGSTSNSFCRAYGCNIAFAPTVGFIVGAMVDFTYSFYFDMCQSNISGQTTSDNKAPKIKNLNSVIVFSKAWSSTFTNYWVEVEVTNSSNSTLIYQGGDIMHNGHRIKITTDHTDW